MDFDPYKVLKVDPTADTEVIAAAYRALSKKYHPDLNKTPEAQTQMQMVNKAYGMLSDPASRAKVDADLNRNRRVEATPQNYGNSGNSWGNTRPSNPATSYNPRYGTGNFSPAPSYTNPEPIVKADDRRRVAEPGPSTFYIYQKRLVDDSQKKILRVAVYHDSLFGKICNINASAPDSSGRVSSGSVFLQNIEMFDVTDAMNEALAVIQKPLEPIEMNGDHDVYYRRKINGLNNSYIVVEVIKQARSSAKQVLFLIGERRGEGVVSSQTEKQLIQIERILTEAFTLMR